MVVDIESRHPVDVLPDRTTETPIARLHDRPGAEAMCRDRASAHARPVKEAAPQAIEVSDRWHLMRNLSFAVERTCHEHRPCLRKYAERTQRAGPRMPAQEAQPPTSIVDRVVWRHEEIYRMVDVGYPAERDRPPLRAGPQGRAPLPRHHLRRPARIRPRPQGRTLRPVQAVSAGRVRRTQHRCSIPAPRKITGWTMRPHENLPLRETHASERGFSPHRGADPVPKLTSGRAEIRCAASRFPSTVGRDRPPTAGRALRPAAPRG
ncbi:transposase [Streptomyces mirabilis]|uniref:transposase n=1 Tax=Streptomyces mirabilis TaxID=68239 RepID=UPI003662C149